MIAATSVTSVYSGTDVGTMSVYFDKLISIVVIMLLFLFQ